MQLALFSTTKICKTCDIEKPVSEYYKHPTTKDCLDPKCKQCRAIYYKQYRAINIDTINERAARYRSDNRDATIEYNKKRYKENKEKLIAQSRMWQAANPDRRNELLSRWRAENPEILLLHVNRRRVRKLNAAGNYDITQLNNRKAMYGDKCYMCGEEATAIDHVKPLAKGGTNWPSNLRPICTKCNCSKGAKWPYELHHISLTRFAEFSRKYN